MLGKKMLYADRPRSLLLTGLFQLYADRPCLCFCYMLTDHVNPFNCMFYFKKSPRQIVNVRFRATVNVILKHGMNSEGIVMDVAHPINAVQNTKEIARTTRTALQVWCVVAKTVQKIRGLVIELTAVSPFQMNSSQVMTWLLSSSKML